MKRLFILLLSITVLGACKKKESSSTIVAPTITGFTPASGVVGATVTIIGTDFSSTASGNTVKFNGTAATVSAASATQLTVTVPSGATTGTVSVTVGSNTATSSASFTVTTASSTTPTISSFTPLSAVAGSTVTITGTNFSTTTANNTVTFNGVAATVTAATSTQLTVTVPSGVSTGKILVTVNGQTVSSSVDFTVASSASACTQTGTVANVVCLAEAFKATLSATQLASLQLSLIKANAIKWSNLPGGVSIRNGLEFSTLSATQLAAAKAVIAAASGATANEGNAEFLQINAADGYLGSNGGGNGYSTGKYIIAFLGTPSLTGTWMLQFGGHHYAQNVTYSNGVTVSGTPSHQGVEPKSWTSNGTTYAPLAQEHDAMADLLASLSTTQLASAKLTTTFSDVLLGPNKDGQFPSTKVGVKVSTLSSDSQAKVLAAMMPWLNDLDADLKASLLATYTNELANTYVSYSGNSSGASGSASSFLVSNADYVRIDGPSVWIEFVCQSGVVMSGIHYHTVFRDHSRDYNGL